MGISTSSSLSSSLSSVGSTSMEKRMADFTADLDVEQFSAHLNDKYAVLQGLHATSDNLGWSSLILNGTSQESQRQSTSSVMTQADAFYPVFFSTNTNQPPWNG